MNQIKKMQFETKLRKIGNSNCVIVPAWVIRKEVLDLDVGDKVLIQVEKSEHEKGLSDRLAHQKAFSQFIHNSPIEVLA